MKGKLLVLSAAAIMALWASRAAASSILVQLDDLTDITSGNTYIDGSLVQSVPFGETVISPYGLWNGGVLQSDVNVRLNILEGDRSLSDTFILTGLAGSTSLSVDFVSDTDGQPLSLIDAISIFETGDWQTVAQFNSLNDVGALLDSYTVQFRSDVEVPEPTTLALFGAGLAALRWSRRRRNDKLART